MQIKDDLENILNILPIWIQQTLKNFPDKNNLVELVLDLGRIPEARFYSYSRYLSSSFVEQSDLDHCISCLKEFNDDNRTGINNTLHRVSGIKNRSGLIIGLTFRIGKAFYGKASIIRDLLESKKSILFLGAPGIGKTTIIREIANILSKEILSRVVIIDTSNEIAGDNDIPDSSIGKSRRLQVSKTTLQHQVMIEAVENHNPEVIIIDEIGTELESLAAQTIAERGIQLIATAHGHSLWNLLKNPTLSNLVGGLQYVTLSDEEAKRLNKKKTNIERKGLATFQIVIELNENFTWTIYEYVELSIDLFLENSESKIQIRNFSNKREMKIGLNYSTLENFSTKTKFEFNKTYFKNKIIQTDKQELKITSYKNPIESSVKIKNQNIITVYCYSLFISEKIIKSFNKISNIKIIVSKNFKQSNIIIGLKSHFTKNLKLITHTKINKIPVFIIEKNTKFFINKILTEIILYQTN